MAAKMTAILHGDKKTSGRRFLSLLTYSLDNFLSNQFCIGAANRECFAVVHAHH